MERQSVFKCGVGKNAAAFSFLSLVLATACEGAGLNHHEKVKMRIVVDDFNFVVASACCDEDVRERGCLSCPPATVGEFAGLLPDFFTYRILGENLFVFAKHARFFFRADATP